jgi:hypothetical protein
MKLPGKRIIPLNLPAGLEKETAGNPVISRLESSPANCFPGLDADVRNLDRRFFPGLVFDFVNLVESEPMVAARGAQVAEVDLTDPDLQSADTALRSKLLEVKKLLDNKTAILLDSITDGNGHKISLLIPAEGNGEATPLDGNFAWRVVRSVEPGPLTIFLSKLTGDKRVHLMELEGERRIYQNESGEFSAAYQPGELTQSLCSPWQHDFRDCACTYWASNHPDIVLAAHPADISEMSEPGKSADRAESPVVWMRSRLDRPMAPQKTGDATWGLEMDHYEINQRWRELSFVLEGREQPAPWTETEVGEAPPLPARDLIPKLKELAGIEQALALEYLYARYTARFYDEDENPQDHQSSVFIAHELLNVAISEMMHLRWVNQVLRELQKLDGRKDPEPELRVAKKVPEGILDEKKSRHSSPRFQVNMRDVAELPIDEAIIEFVAAEAPSGSIEGQYARIRSRLKLGWPKEGNVRPDLIGLVDRIIGDGVDHYAHFRQIEALLRRPDKEALVKPLEKLKPADPNFRKAERLYAGIMQNLRSAFKQGDGAAQAAGAAHQKMRELDTLATELAKTKGKAIPFLRIAAAYSAPVARAATPKAVASNAPSRAGNTRRRKPAPSR